MEGAIEVLVEAHCKLALTAVSEFPLDIANTIAHWTAAVKLSEQGDNAATVLTQICEVAIGRAANLTERSEDQLDALNDAVELLQRVIDEGWDTADTKLSRALANALVDRAVHLSNEFNAEREARDDALRAYNIAPDSVRAIDALCQSSLFLAGEKFISDEEASRALVQEVEEILTTAEQQFPDNARWEKIRSNLTEAKNVLESGGQDLSSFLQALPPLPSEGDEYKVTKLLADAMLMETRKDFAGAVQTYQSILQADAAHHSVRAKMAWCYRTWLLEMASTGNESAEVMRKLAREAAKQCPNSEALSDILTELSLDRES
jgi:hypothetical protein